MITILKDNSENIIATLALIISIISYLQSKKSSVADIRPILVFVYDGRIGWIIKNIGNGPALNIIVAQIKGEWFNPVRIPPLSANCEFVMSWLQHVDDTGLGANYNDFENRIYSATCGNDLSQVIKGPTLPKWNENEIGRHYNHPIYKSGA
ncbi:MAG: hypothetical protein ACO1OF_17900 [Adhaeribacter sp.]